MTSFDNLYDVAGSADAPPILFLHVVGSTRKWFLPQFHALSDEYRVLAVDLPGHGVLADARFTFDAAIAVIENVIHAAIRGRVLLAGVSLGAYMTIVFAARHPERVAGLVLSGVARLRDIFASDSPGRAPSRHAVHAAHSAAIAQVFHPGN